VRTVGVDELEICGDQMDLELGSREREIGYWTTADGLRLKTNEHEVLA